MGGGVDIQLVLLSVPDKASSGFLNGQITVPVRLVGTTKHIQKCQQNAVKRS